jgi:glutamate-5-semialdehyde dehydrogenase
MTLAPEKVAGTTVEDAVLAVCRRAKVASRPLRVATRATKDAALHAIADAIDAATERIVAANAEDLARGEADGTSQHLLDRLRLDPVRVAAVAAAVREVAALPDPVGEVVRGSTLPNGASPWGCSAWSTRPDPT